jgi:ABC-type amino acid transport substrate-binding protein
MKFVPLPSTPASMTTSPDTETTASGRRRCLQGLGAAGFAAFSGLALGLGAATPASATPLAKVRERGQLTVAMYHEMPPFHNAGQGIDVEIARLLAEGLGVKLSVLGFPADDNLNDDLRNMVWRGHYLGHGPADVMIHVPVDKPLMDANPRVRIFAPYFRERVAMARNLARLPQLDTMAALKGQPIAVAGQSLAGWLLLGADGGAYREQVTTRWKDGTEAARALVDGQCTVAAGHQSELESVLRGDARFAIEPMPMPRAPRDGWAVGLAVKKDSEDLARELQRVMGDLAQSGKLAAIFEAAKVSWKPV